jgi:hypothetical protein
MSKFSENGVPLLSGLGISLIRNNIAEAFEKMREGSSRKEVLEMLGSSAPLAVEVVVTSVEETAARFHKRVEKLSRAALECSHIHVSTTGREAPRGGTWDAGDLDKNYTADDVIAVALQPEKMESKKDRKRA